MSRATALPIMLALSACAQTPPPAPQFQTVYDCSETRTTPEGRFAVEPGQIQWSRDLGGGIKAQFVWGFIDGTERDGFDARGYAASRTNEPVTFFDFDPKLDARNIGPDGHWKSMLAARLEIGRYVFKADMPSNMTFAIRWSEVQQLLQGEGEVKVTLRDSAGNILQQGSMPHDGWQQAERILMEMHAQVMVRYRDKEHLCPSHQEEVGQEIIVT